MPRDVTSPADALRDGMARGGRASQQVGEGGVAACPNGANGDATRGYGNQDDVAGRDGVGAIVIGRISELLARAHLLVLYILQYPIS